MNMKPLSPALALAIFLSSIGFSSVPVIAQELDVEEVIVTGARGQPRSVQDSPVPVDVFSSEDLEAVAFTDTNDVLMTLVPSYSVSRQPISDGGTFIRPATLRGLTTDKTLVLVNSKRRHRASLVSIGGSGTQGPDVATVPASALKTVEVLRDGAAAQYGSDAIAGVINFILKDNSEGGSIAFDSGQYTEGDGFMSTLSGNYGMPLGSNGFFSLSGEISTQETTTRAEQYCQSWACVDADSPDFLSGSSFDTTLAGYDADAYAAALSSASLVGDGSVVQPWGQPNADAMRFFYNAGYELDSGAELYSFGSYSSSESDGGFFYRYAGNGTIENIRLEDGSLYSFLEIFPGGFTPNFSGDVSDMSVVGGIRGDFGETSFYDFSIRTGSNEIQYTLANTVNPSLGDETPTSFRPGDLINEETQIQLDFSTEFDTGGYSPLLFAYGLSYMDESYEVVEGEEASYIDGPYASSDPWGFCNADMTASAAGLAVIANGSTLDCSDTDDAVYRVIGVGSNGFPGYSPLFSDVYERDSYAAYADVSTDVSDSLFVQGALRYESYSDFDAELVGKIAAQYDINDTFSLRGSYGTGFRAPTPGQQGTTNVSTRLPNGLPVATGLFPASSPVAQALGATDLKPETSTNYTLGLTAAFDKLSLSVDLYKIDLADRTYAISTLDVSTDATTGADYDNYLALVNAGVVGAESIGGVFYFTNAFDSETTGMDIVATYPLDWDNGSTTQLSAALNYNKSEIVTDPSAVLNDEDWFDFENDDPEWRSVITATHSIGDLSLMARANLYGSYENGNGSGDLSGDGIPGDIQEFDPIALFDIEGRYQLTDMTTISVGGRNIFDSYPEEDAIGDFCCGRIYSSGTAVSWQGAYYYLKLGMNF